MLDFVKAQLMSFNNARECPKALEASALKLKKAINDKEVTHFKCDGLDSLEQLKHLQTWMKVNDTAYDLYITANEGIVIDENDQAQGVRIIPHPLTSDHQRVIEVTTTKTKERPLALFVEQYSSLTETNRYRVDGYRLTQDQEMRSALLAGMNYWVCKECDVGVNCMKMPCPRCQKHLKMIPIYEYEINEVNDAMREAHSNSIRRDTSKYPWYCRDCYMEVEDTTLECAGCDRELNATDAVKYRSHKRPELHEVLDLIKNLRYHEITIRHAK